MAAKSPGTIVQTLLLAFIVASLAVLATFAIHGIHKLDERRDVEILSRLTGAPSMQILAVRPEYPKLGDSPVFALQGLPGIGYAALVRLTKPGYPSLVAVTLTSDAKINSLREIATGKAESLVGFGSAGVDMAAFSSSMTAQSLELPRALAAISRAIADSTGKATGK